MSRVFGAALLSSSLVVAFAPRAAADDAPVASADDRKQAARDFADGDRAFKDGDFRQAAEAYERAYHRVPHHSALWNAARSWHRAGELARAANLYARYLREAPGNARDRNGAQRAMNELSGRLARLEIHAPDVVGAVRVDGQEVEATSLFVTPGAHVVEGRTRGDRPVRQSPTVGPGDVVSVALVPAAGPPTPGAAPAPLPPAPERHRRGWSPVVVYFGGAVTLALAGITLWSGIDTLQQKDVFDRTPSQNNLDVGRDKQSRTNVLLAASVGAGALTAATAIVLVDWRGGSREKDAEPRVQLGAGPGSLVLRGAF